MKRLIIIVCLLFALDGLFFFAMASEKMKQSSRIVGGTEADRSEWPWVVALVKSNTSSNYYGQFCGGSLVSPKWVVTAAHCIVDDDGSQSVYPSDLQILVGAHDLKSGEGERVNVRRIVVHPSYSPGAYNNDIALIELEKNVSVETLPLYDGSEDLSGYDAIAIGWGSTSGIEGQYEYPGIRNQVTLPIVTNTECNAAYGGFITDSMVCAGYIQGGKDACYGDSGGPLVINRNSRWELAGVTSWGSGCAKPGYYGVFASISKFKPFVDYYLNSVCKIVPKSLFLNINQLPVAGNPILFSVSSISECYDYLYYYYSYAPDYGTDNYDPVNGWVKMLPGDGFSNDRTVGYTFNRPGYYVVVAGMYNDRAITSPMTQIGCTVAVKDPSAGSSGTCRVTPKSLSIEGSSIPVAGSPVTFNVNAVSECSGSIYYYFSYAPNYGSDDYDSASGWVKMINSADGFTSNSIISYTFNDPGYYVVVAWASPRRSVQNPVALIGATVPVNPSWQ